MKIHYKRILIAAVVVGMVSATAAATHVYGYYSGQKDTKSSSPFEGGITAFDKAAFTFGVTDLKRNGNTVTFTIPKDAHALEKQADAVEISGLYDLGKSKPVECPMVESTAVSKSVRHYNPMSGKADVKALFDDEEMAQTALEKGCLLIHDPS